MTRRLRIAIAAIVAAAMCGLSACDGGGSPSPSPSAPTSKTPTPSPSPIPADPELKAAQDQYKAFYAAYIDAERRPPTGRPPASLLKFADPDGPLPDWLHKAFASDKKVQGRIVGGRVVVTTGPLVKESSDAGTKTFNACNDARTLKLEQAGKPVEVNAKWELVQVKMTAAPGANSLARRRPSGWRVHAFNQITVDRPCTYS